MLCEVASGMNIVLGGLWSCFASRVDRKYI